MTALGPLHGLRIIELGHFVAAPFAGRLLADLGAEVIKVEPPSSGDPARQWGAMAGNRSIWWSVHARNKKSVTVDVKTSPGRDLILDLIRDADALIENYRPGQLERWGLGPDVLKATNPDCVVVRISGFGQDGPYRDKPAFGVIGEALGGIRYLTGYPKTQLDLPPVRVGISLGDSVAGLYAVIGVLAGVLARRHGSAPASPVDIAIYEAVFSLLEGALPEFSLLGIVRQPAGSAIPTVAPSNSYQTSDGEWICIAGNSDRIFQRLSTLIGRPEMARDPRFSTNDGRVAHMAKLDAMIAEWVAGCSASEAATLLEAADVPACRIYTIADCANDAHFIARGMIRQVDDPALGLTLHPGVVPRFAEWVDAPMKAGPELGANTEEVLTDILNYTPERIADLRHRGIVT